MAGRPRLPTEYKKHKGTLNKTEDKRYKDTYADDVLKESPMILDQDKVLRVPATLKEEYVKEYYKNIVGGLKYIGVLSGADLPQIEQMCVYLQKLREVEKIFIKSSPFDEDFDQIEKRYSRLVNQFNMLAQKYYVSPVARAKIRLDELTIKDKELSVAEKEKSAVSKLLANRGK